MEQNNPLCISVIITAYDRKEFLLNAIESAVNQTLNKKDYEIIVVKNFKDDTIDEYCDKHSIKNILITGGIGEFLYAGISMSSGQIISFLDDDDLFTKDKLQIVYEKFRNSNLCYYHNSHSLVNEKYQEYDGNIEKDPVFNMSSISVRKSILNLGNIKKINLHPDDFMYLSALDSGKSIIADNEKLTYYMRHNSISQIETKNINDFIKMKNTYSKRSMDSFRSLNEMFISKNCKSYIKQRIAELEITEYLFGNKTKPRNSLNVFKKSLRPFSSRFKYYLAYLLVRIHYNFRYLVIRKMFNFNTKIFNNK